MLEASADLAAFVRDPVGRCIAGRTWLYFYADEAFCGFVVWGKPTREDLVRLVLVLKVELGKPAHVALVDARRVEDAEPRGFRVLERYVREHHDALGEAVERLAIVRPDGLLGAVTAGFFGVAPQPYPVKVFDDRAAAVRWLGIRDADGVLAALAREEERAAGEPPVLRDVRALVEARLDRAALDDVARAMGLSARTLQRKLGEHGATFQALVNETRVRVAKRLLREGDASLTAIAGEVGCASLASFSALFRRATGQTPSAFRAASRAAGSGARAGVARQPPGTRAMGAAQPVRKRSRISR
jgi:AraC-like DNA-binding protein